MDGPSLGNLTLRLELVSLFGSLDLDLALLADELDIGATVDKAGPDLVLGVTRVGLAEVDLNAGREG